MENKNIGFLAKFGMRGIERVLEGEEIIDAISGTVGLSHGGAKQNGMFGVLVLTNTRLILYNNKIIGHTSVDFQLSKINNVVSDIDIVYGQLQIHSVDDVIFIKRASKKDGERFAKTLKNQMSLLNNKNI